MFKTNYLVLTVLLILVSLNSFCQLKLGGTPSRIQKSSILELESSNQGLLLSRITDTTAINLLNPLNGMIIYFTPSNRLLIRSAGKWQTLSQSETSTLAALTDVLLTVPVDGQYLKFNGSKWINYTPNFLTAVDTSDIQNFYMKVRGLLSAGNGLAYNNGTGVFTNSGVLSVNGNTGALTIDTTYIADFHQKVRSEISSTTPLTYVNGLMGITQATTSAGGYLSSADWNMFNSKGGGSVTSVSVTTANGVSGAVETPTTTPAITLTLGAITPSSVAATGSISGVNLSGTNSGDITIATANGLSLAAQALSLATASISVTGALSSTDWNTFNNKAGALSGTLNYIPRFTSSAALGNSTLQDNGFVVSTTAANGLLATGTFGAGAMPVVGGAGTRMVWMPSKAAFRAGYVSGNNWDSTNIGNYSTAFGQDNKASGISAFASGYLSIASGSYSTAMGNAVLASGTNSFALGSYVSTGGFSGAVIFGDANSTLTSNDITNQLKMRFSGGYKLYTDALGTTTGLQITTAGVMKYNANYGASYDARSLVDKNYVDSVKTATSAAAWSLLGNGGTIAGTNFMGTSDNIDVVFKRNSVQSGLLNVALQNTSWGVSALNPATTGISNNAFGFAALFSNSTGMYNTASGYNSLYNNTTGSFNTGIGPNTLNSNVAGSNGVAIGTSSQQYVNSTATPWINNNTSVGTESLKGSLTASANTGTYNTAVGYQALAVNSTGSSNAAIGSGALTSNTTGLYNIAIGVFALRYNLGGYQNIAIGPLSLNSNISGNDNIAVGMQTMLSNTTGVSNVGVGNMAINSSVSGSQGVAVGYLSQQFANNTTTPWTNQNVAVGAYSLQGSTTASANTGNSNTAIGYQSMQLNSTGSNNLAIGYRAGNTDGTVTTPGNLSNATAIGSNAQVTASNSVVLGGTGAYAANVGIGVTNPAYKLDVFSTTNPLRLTGLAVGATSDSLLTISAAGIVRKLPFSAATSGASWGLSGNGGTIAGTNYMGTTDNIDVVFKRFGVQSGLLNVALQNTSWGVSALNPGTTSLGSSAFGAAALSSNSTGAQNSAFGYLALQSNTTGGANTANGVGALSSNAAGSSGVAIGYHSQFLANSTTTPWGNDNTSVGYQSLQGSATAANNTGLSNTAVGYNTLAVNSTGAQNTALGTLALGSNTSGNANIGTGLQSMFANTTGSSNVATGSLSLFKNVAGSGGVAVGHYSQMNVNNISSSWINSNTSVGYQSLQGSETASNNTGLANTVIGFQTMLLNSTGSNNTAAGNGALFKNTTGNQNTAVGSLVLSNTTSGEMNTGNGFLSLNSNIAGSNNVGYGAYSLYSNVAGNGGVAIGHFSQLYVNNTTSPWENTNTSVGYQSLYGSATASANTGLSNTAIGYKAMISNTSGNENTASGKGSLSGNTLGGGNSAYGANSLAYNQVGNYNTAVGDLAMFGNISASNSAAVGSYSLYANTTGANNTALGYQSSYINTTGNSNTAIGFQAGASNITGSSNTALGYLAGSTDGVTPTPGNISNSTAIGSYAQVTTSNSMVLGGMGTYGVNVGIGVTAPLSRLDVAGSVGLAIATTTTSLLLDASHYSVIITAGTPTITLPAPASSNARRIYVIVNQTGANIGTSSFINFAGATISVVAPASSITIQSNGTSWYRIQ